MNREAMQRMRVTT